MTQHRFFLPPSAFQRDVVCFPEDVAHQITRVLRLESGDVVLVLDGSGMEMAVRLQIGRQVSGTIEERWPNAAEPRLQVTLYIGLPKAAKLEVIVQKCTEIGVAAIVPMLTERSVPTALSEAKQSRLEAIAREAAEQSRRGRVPEVRRAVPLAEAVADGTTSRAGILLWEEARDIRLEDARLPQRASSCALFVGPEGGFSPGEVTLAREAGIALAGLGPRILRSETAAIVGTALLLARAGDLG